MWPLECAWRPLVRKTAMSSIGRTYYFRRYKLMDATRNVKVQMDRFIIVNGDFTFLTCYKVTTFINGPIYTGVKD